MMSDVSRKTPETRNRECVYLGIVGIFLSSSFIILRIAEKKHEN